VRRSLRRIHAGEDAPSPEEVGLDLADGDYSLVHRRAHDWVERMLVARTLEMSLPGRDAAMEIRS